MVVWQQSSVVPEALDKQMRAITIVDVLFPLPSGSRLFRREGERRKTPILSERLSLNYLSQ